MESYFFQNKQLVIFHNLWNHIFHKWRHRINSNWETKKNPTKDTVNQLWESKFEKSISIKNKRLLKKSNSHPIFLKKNNKIQPTTTDGRKFTLQKKNMFFPIRRQKQRSPNGAQRTGGTSHSASKSMKPKTCRKKVVEVVEVRLGCFFCYPFFVGTPPKKSGR